MSFLSKFLLPFRFVFTSGFKLMFGKLLFGGIFSLLFILIITLSSISESIQERSPKPFLLALGEVTLNADNKVRASFTEMNNGEVSAYGLFSAYGGVFLMFFMARLWYKVFKSFLIDAPFIIGIIVFAWMMFLQETYAVLTLHQLVIPFEGTFFHMPKFLISKSGDMVKWLSTIDLIQKLTPG